MDEILRSPAYAASLRRTETKSAAVCGGCQHYGYCSGYDIHAEPIVATYPTGCPVTASVQDHIKSFLVDFGYRPPGLPGSARPDTATERLRAVRNNRDHAMRIATTLPHILARGGGPAGMGTRSRMDHESRVIVEARSWAVNAFYPLVPPGLTVVPRFTAITGWLGYVTVGV